MSGPQRPSAPAPQYKGGELEPARGPGLGCFYAQLVLLVVLLVLTPVSAFARWNPLITLVLMVVLIILLLVTGQTMIFLLRIVAAERGRRRPLAARGKTVGEIEAEQNAPAPPDSTEGAGTAGVDVSEPRDDAPGMRE